MRREDSEGFLPVGGKCSHCSPQNGCTESFNSKSWRQRRSLLSMMHALKMPPREVPTRMFPVDVSSDPSLSQHTLSIRAPFASVISFGFSDRATGRYQLSPWFPPMMRWYPEGSTCSLKITSFRPLSITISCSSPLPRCHRTTRPASVATHSTCPTAATCFTRAPPCCFAFHEELCSEKIWLALLLAGPPVCTSSSVSSPSSSSSASSSPLPASGLA
mmetsp:Transcript_40176/g.94505  ORF Transcript_40176/g.94505 Transcript_40176/m.94505 type:complete len:217 (+) Transcript_40176:1-651(+)